MRLLSHEQSSLSHVLRLPLIIVVLLTSMLNTACVVKEELDNTYNQAHLGLNQWSLFEQDNGAYRLEFDVGYLIGLSDSEGVSAINWTFELITVDREILSYTAEQMRDASPEKDAVFVEGRRVRTLDLETLLDEGETYILWFTLKYRDEILHEQLFPLIAGEEGGDPNWIEDLLGENFEDPSQISSLLPAESTSMTTAEEASEVDADVGQSTEERTDEPGASAEE